MESNMVIIITINYNQSRMTLDCVDSVLKSTYTNYKLIVVDNGSTKYESKYLMNNINSQVLVKKIENNCGYVGGVNHGLKFGSKFNPDYYLIMNNDTIIDRNAIQNIVHVAIKFNNNAIVTGKVYHYDKPDTIQTTGSFFSDRRYLKEVYPCQDELDNKTCEKEEERDMIDDIFWIIPEKVFNQVGFYSNNFFLYAEQADYALRAVKKGFRLVYTPKAKLWHKGEITTGGGEKSSPIVSFWRYKSGLIYLYRNSKKKYFYLGLVKSFPKLLIKYIFSSIGIRKDKYTKSDAAAFIGYLHGFKWLLNKKPDNGYNPFIK